MASPSRTHNRIRKLLKLLGSDANEARIEVADKAAPMTSAALPLAAPVTVQLRSTRSNVCWESTYTAGDIDTTSTGKFSATTGS